MAIKQLSVFVENKPCKLMDTTKVLAKSGINLRAMSVADTKDFGILRLIVTDINKAKEILSEDYLVTITDVVAVKMKDESGSLYTILEALGDEGINIEYMYAFTASGNSGAYVVFRVDDNETAEKVLASKGIEILNEENMPEI